LAKGLGHTHRLETGVGLRVDPKVVLSSQILQLTQQELDQAIEAELLDNPALERLHEDGEPLSDEAILRAVAPQELRPASEDFEFYRSMPQDDRTTDWTELAATTTSLWDHLRAQLGTMLPDHLREIGNYVVECVNERGYLNSPAEEIALATDSSLDDVEFVLGKLKQCEPAGVGASSVQECLLLQLKDADTVERKLARIILKAHMDDFLARRTYRIMRRYRVLTEVVEAAFAEILKLTPYPGEAFQVGPSVIHTASIRTPSVIPDLVITIDETGWHVEVRGADPNALAIERAYRRRYDELRQQPRADRDEKRHVTEYVRRAANFIQSVYQRRRTLRRIGEYLVEHQASFISTGGYQFLRPLTRTQMAKDLGMHESTVSRATMGKFVQIANGETISFEVFFKPALRIQKMIEEILSTENPSDPLSDEQIAALLKKKGVYVARRTVNKYRDKTKLLSSRKRRSA
jgi:RNA polymerase sigma-54 factor